ncbi:hypothetical protein BurJ1DRAFT_0282 [Burkholderiales bacterium JOSHI_001]|nr:hypothetical protein BurJ1DRAFT_0282 [Burkholderiales bacterium JOSHI_001]
MRSLFEGTPVAFTDEADGSLRVDVPMEFGFEFDSAKMKPALRAVLDKLSQSLARQRGAHLQLGPPEPQLRERLAAMRDFLVGKKVSRSRLPATPNLSAGVVLLRLSPTPPPVLKLEDASPMLPMPAARPAAAPKPAAPAPTVKPPASR